jgi:hypothetical protein
VQRCEVTDLGVQECAHCRALTSPAAKPAPKEPSKQRPTPPQRRTRAGNVGRRADGRHLRPAQLESKCEVCQLPLLPGDLMVRDDFGQLVHDRCYPDIASATTPTDPSPSGTPLSRSHPRGQRGKRTQSRSHQRSAAMPAPEGALEVYTDGACPENPGPGGWAWVVDDGRRQPGLSP